MSQLYPPETNGPGRDSTTGVTAVIDSLIRHTDERERKSEEPLVKRRSPSPLLSDAEVLDLSQAPTDVARTTQIKSAPSRPIAQINAQPETTPPAAAPATSPSRLPAPATRIAFTERSQLGRPMWSMAAATALRLPDRILEGLSGLRDGDDAQWLGALVKLVAPMCRGLKDDPTMLASSGSTELAAALGLDVQEPGFLPPYGGSIYCIVDNTAAGLEWAKRVRGDRLLHLVLDGTDTDLFQIGEPDAVSYTTRKGAIAALEVADSTGAAIGFGLNNDGTPIRATALEIALAIRSLVRTRR